MLEQLGAMVADDEWILEGAVRELRAAPVGPWVFLPCAVQPSKIYYFFKAGRL